MSEENQEMKVTVVPNDKPEQQADPQEVASQLLHFYTPVYENLVNQLSSKAMRRLLKKLVEYPLNEKQMNGTSAIENQAFAIGLRLIEARTVLELSLVPEMIKQSTQQQMEENKETNG
jgi:hypothetical protein